MSCEECGSRSISVLQVGSHRIEECELCGHLQGEDRAVLLLEEQREAESLGWQPELLGLVRALESVPGLKAERVQPGDVDARVMPTIFFTIKKGMSASLEKLVASLTMGMRETHHRWLIEVTYQRQLLLVLRPRLFHGLEELDPSEIERAIEDIARLRDALQRDMKLDWWSRSS